MTLINNLLGDTFQSVASPFVEIWNFILFNILSPLLVVVFVILFFVGQYYLIKMYIKLFQYVIGNIIKLIGWIIQNKKVINWVKNFNDSLAD